MIWHRQKEYTPEQNDALVYRLPDADTPREYIVIHEDNTEEKRFDNKGRLEFCTKPVLVFYGNNNRTNEPMFCIDLRRKFNDREKWIWTKLEGAEDWDEISWMEIPDGFDINNIK